MTEPMTEPWTVHSSSTRARRGGLVVTALAAVVLAGSLPSAPTASAVPSASGDAGATARVAGTYAVLQPDLAPDAEPGTPAPSAQHYVVTDDGDLVPLTEPLAEVVPGQEVLVTGEEAPGSASTAPAPGAVQDAPVEPVTVETLGAAPEADASGARSLAVVLLRRGPDGPEPATVDEMRAAVFTAPSSVAAYFAENSFGAMTLQGRDRADGDVHGYLEVPATTGCYQEVSAGTAAAEHAGLDLAGYDHVAFVMAGGADCPYSGWAWIGGRESVTLYAGTSRTRGTLQHELGHNLGLGHANLLLCNDAQGTLTPYRVEGGTCGSVEYGDRFDTMGGSDGHLHFSANHKAQLGWIPASRITTVTASGTYRVTSSSAPSDDPQVLRIPLSEAAHLDVDVRRPVGEHFEANVSLYPALADGVSVRLVDRNGQQLLDMVPGGWAGDAPLTLGRTFNDPASGVTLRVDAVDDASATLTVTLRDVHPQMYLRGTHNAWGRTPMVREPGTRDSWTAEVTFGRSGAERFKFDVHGDWSENYGDVDRDGLVERGGPDIPVLGGAGSYLVTFDALAGTYQLDRTSFASTYPTMTLRGTHNGWGADPMELVADFTWQTTAWFGGSGGFKLDVDGTWRTNFGDTDRDGRLDPGGADIPSPTAPGRYVVSFHEGSRVYQVVPAG